MTKYRSALLAATMTVAISPLQVSTAATQGIQVGVLTCSVVPGSRMNLLVHSSADVECVFENEGKVENYRGETGIAIGLDAHLKSNEKFAFAVLAASSDVTPGAMALAGKYVGGTLGASAGVGLTASALVGGGAKNVSLQPLALGAQTGVGASGGIGYLRLEGVN
jgi:hypothetical protein